MNVDAQSLEKQLPVILEKFNAVLNDCGIQAKVTRFTIGNPDDPAENEKQQKIGAAISAAFTKPESESEIKPQSCFVCCDQIGCFWCCIA